MSTYAEENKYITYTINDKDQLINPKREKNTVMWEKQKDKQKEHQEVFNQFADIIPRKHREEVQYFSLFYNDNHHPDQEIPAATMGTIDIITRTPFILSALYPEKNRSFDPTEAHPDWAKYSSSASTFIHELGHYLTMNNKAEPFFAEIRPISWDKPDQPKKMTEEEQEKHFLTPYAKRNLLGAVVTR